MAGDTAASLVSKEVGAITLNHSFLMKGWALKVKNFSLHFFLEALLLEVSGVFALSHVAETNEFPNNNKPI